MTWFQNARTDHGKLSRCSMRFQEFDVRIMHRTAQSNFNVAVLKTAQMLAASTENQEPVEIFILTIHQMGSINRMCSMECGVNRYEARATT